MVSGRLKAHERIAFLLPMRPVNRIHENLLPGIDPDPW